jgi:hypothetical protein
MLTLSFGVFTTFAFHSFAVGAWAASILVPVGGVLLIFSEYTTGESLSQAAERQKIEREERTREQVRRTIRNQTSPAPGHILSTETARHPEG